MTRWQHLSADERSVLGTVFWSPASSRHALSARLGFSKRKTNGVIAGLLAHGLLDEGGVQVSSGGRRAETLRLSADLGVLVGIDLGATSLDIAVMRPDLTVRAGTWIGQMLASVVNFFNPSHVFIGGGITRIGPLFLAAVRQSVYHRSLALSTRRLEIQYAPLAERGGVVGAGVLALHESMKLQGALA